MLIDLIVIVTFLVLSAIPLLLLMMTAVDSATEHVRKERKHERAKRQKRKQENIAREKARAEEIQLLTAQEAAHLEVPLNVWYLDLQHRLERINTIHELERFDWSAYAGAEFFVNN